jgi:sterol 3beta-glucosyltransferase
MSDNDPQLSTITHRPEVAPTLNTSPDALEMSNQPVSEDSQRSQGSSRVKRLSATIEKTVDKLTRSTSPKSSSPTPTSSTPRRVFSLSRKTRHQGSGSEEHSGATGASSFWDSSFDEHIAAQGSPTGSSLVVNTGSKTLTMPADDSPFISPPSPPPRPSLTPFRGDGSVRHGPIA